MKKLKKTNQFVMRSLGDETVLIPRGEMAEEVNGVITLSETAAFIYEKAPEAENFEALAQCLSREYQISTEESRKDLREILEQMKQSRMLKETNREKAW